MAEHNLVGKRGEEIALNHLQEKEYKVLAANWRYQRAEIDIICTYKSFIIVVEVKTRTSAEFESPKEAVTIAKQKQIVKAADAYIQQNNIDLECRFDIVSVLIQGKKVEIEHIEEAFLSSFVKFARARI